ncbi:MAG: UvrD-helicase domain-containing protein [Chloroflexi bacterium]|nr:UvrD-helicase domain-containing protein [Chloroflexota bacterium]
MDALADLNPAQKDAVETVEGPLLVLAGPGSGKTRVITHRIAYLVQTLGVSPRRIMAVTFTNKAAGEMRSRLQAMLGPRAAELTVGTFHAICARILRIEGAAIGLDSQFAIYDDDDQMNVIKQAMEQLGIDPKRFSPRALQSAIDAAKSQLVRVQDYAGRRNNYADEIIHRVYQRYQEILHRSQALDFDDLLVRTHYLFEEHPDILSKYQNRYVHVLIDEFQDTNIAQYSLARQMAGKYKNICVVGDPDQSIYSWRHADIRNILSFEKDYPNAKVVFLEQNYRSTQTIVEAAHHIILPNLQRKQYKLWTENDKGAPIVVAEAYNEQEEAQLVAQEIEKLMGQKEARLRDVAIMYRTNAQSRALEDTFIRYGTPYKIVGATRFYERREIKDAIAYLRLIYNPLDSVSLSRIINVPPRGIGQRTIDELSSMAQARGLPLYHALQAVADKSSAIPVASRTAAGLAGFYSMMEELRGESQKVSAVELLDLVLEKTGYKKYVQQGEDGEDRWDNIQELRNVAREKENLSDFLEGVALVSDLDNLDERSDTATLITLHQAKGLEFDVVFIVGMEEGVLPHVRSFDSPEQMEEERRLCYVGVTRARRRLYLVRAFRRSLGGMSGANPPSRFLKDIPSKLIAGYSSAKETAVTAMGVTPRPAAPLLVLPELKPGDSVKHGVFGEGVVVSAKPVKDDKEVVVAFPRIGVKKLLLSYAKLEKVR